MIAKGRARRARFVCAADSRGSRRGLRPRAFSDAQIRRNPPLPDRPLTRERRRVLPGSRRRRRSRRCLGRQAIVGECVGGRQPLRPDEATAAIEGATLTEDRLHAYARMFPCLLEIDGRANTAPLLLSPKTSSGVRTGGVAAPWAKQSSARRVQHCSQALLAPSSAPSGRRRAPGKLSRQGPPALRWALFEAAQCARRRSSPDHPYYREAAQRLGGNRACLAVSRKLLKRSYHTLRELGEEACNQHDLATARHALRHPDAPRPAPGKLLPPPAGGRPS
jgi:hypothetical protein